MNSAGLHGGRWKPLACDALYALTCEKAMKSWFIFLLHVQTFIHGYLFAWPMFEGESDPSYIIFYLSLVPNVHAGRLAQALEISTFDLINH